MSSDLVLEASAAIAILRREPSRDRVVEILRQRSRRGVLVPAHFWIEVVNVLATRYRETPEDVLAALHALDAFAIETVEIDRPLLLLTLALAAEHRLAAYDSAYLAVAEAQGADLLTLDADLATAAGPRAMQVGPRRLHEERAHYRTRTPHEVWSRYGAYLAELRKQARAG